MAAIEELYPQRVFHYFLEISKIPRGSGNEKAVSDYLVEFAKKHGLYYHQDEFNNVLIRKEASKGYEKYAPIALQGHMDMVCEKNRDVEFDFEKEPIKVMVKDGFLTADGTTLGADNGISLGMTLAILESKEIKHPMLEVILTTDEEVSMKGAQNFDVNLLKSNILINIDSEEYGAIYVSSAGSATVKADLLLETEKLNGNVYVIDVKGLLGGHSGGDIHENRANADKILAEILRRVNVLLNIHVIDFNGGNKDNTIPREAMATISTTASKEELEEQVAMVIDSLNFKYKESEKEMLAIVEESHEKVERQMTKESTEKLINYLSGHIVGVVRKSKEIEGLIQTSLNLGVVKTITEGDKKILRTHCLIRSGVFDDQEKVAKFVVAYGKKMGADSRITGSERPWEYKKDSKIRDYFAKVFEEQTGEKPRILAIHAGLECGIFSEKNPKLDVISIGPDIKNPHTPDERMSIQAVAQTWEYLIKALEDYRID